MVLASLGLALLLNSVRPNIAIPKPHRRWLYLATNLLVDANVTKDIELIDKAKALGYNGVVVADSKFCRWDSLPQSYFDNCQKFRQAVKSAGMEFIACVAPIGYSSDLLGKDPNLAEALPVKDSPFIATKEGTLIPVAEELLKNGDFSQMKGESPAGWDWVDQPGKICIVDPTGSPSGGPCLEMTNIGKYDPQAGHARAEQSIAVHPFTEYHVQAQVKTSELATPGAVQILALGAHGESLQSASVVVDKTADWKKYDFTFNSLDNTSLSIYFGVWGGSSGAIWWSNLKVEPAGMVNLVRRDGAPFKVSGDDGTVYKEGKDYTGAQDPKMGNIQWPGDYDSWHTPPTMTLPSGSRIQPGQQVKVSYYHTQTVYDGQVTMCLAEPATMDLIRWQIHQVHLHLQPDGYMLSHDEIRMGGWDAGCEKSGKTQGQLLAENIRDCLVDIRKEDPGKETLVWSDMFDPNHNARPTGSYYLVKGDGPLSGSWKGLDKNVIVLNWQSNPDTRDKSLAWFESLGCRQILAGYYDGPPDSIVPWQKAAQGVSGFDGVMYTTWAGNYDNLAAFAKAAGF